MNPVKARLGSLKFIEVALCKIDDKMIIGDGKRVLAGVESEFGCPWISCLLAGEVDRDLLR